MLIPTLYSVHLAFSSSQNVLAVSCHAALAHAVPSAWTNLHCPVPSCALLACPLDLSPVLLPQESSS